MKKFDLDLFKKITYIHFLTDYSSNDFPYPPLFVRDDFNEEKELRDYLKNIKKRFSEISGLNIYVHFPFCKYKCVFCRQFSFACQDFKLYDEYLELLIKELKMWVEAMKLKGKAKIRSIYLGGGTPTNFDLKKFFYKISEFIDLKSIEQIDIESTLDPLSNPKTLSFLKRLKLNQKSRLVMGAQSFNEEVLKACNRYPYQKRIFREVMKNIKKNKIPVVGIDLMAGLPLQTEESLIKDVKFIINEKVEAIHLYVFCKNPLTPLWNKNKKTSQKEREMVKETYGLARRIIESNDYPFTGGEWILRRDKKFLNYQQVFIGSPFEEKEDPFNISIGPSAGGRLPFYSDDKFCADIRNVSDLNIYKQKILNQNFAIEKIWKFKDETELKRKGLVRIMRYSFLDKRPYIKKYGADPEKDFPQEFEFLEKTLTRLGKFERKRDVINFKNNLGGHLILSKVFYSPEVLKRCKKVIEEKYKNLDFDLSFLPHNEDFFIKKHEKI